VDIVVQRVVVPAAEAGQIVVTPQELTVLVQQLLLEELDCEVEDVSDVVSVVD